MLGATRLKGHLAARKATDKAGMDAHREGRQASERAERARPERRKVRAEHYPDAA